MVKNDFKHLSYLCSRVNESKCIHFHLLGHSKPVISVSVTQKAIEAQDRSPITLTIGDNATALTDSSVTLLCHVSGVPKPIVTWTKFGQTIVTGGRYTVQDNGELLIDGAREEDEAQYKCTAVNVAGQDSESSYIRVVGKRTSTSIWKTIDLQSCLYRYHKPISKVK